jgi:polyphenol oxidase
MSRRPTRSEPPTPFERLGEDLSIRLSGATALFTSRQGGCSTGPYASLNLGFLTDDDPAAVRRNRETLAQRLHVEPAWGLQVHGNRVTRVSGPSDPDQPPPEADGQATAVPGVAPMVLTADCLPVAIAAPGAVAMVHAGWRGLAGGVLQAGLAAVRELGGTGRAQAAIGPGAGRCCYEVGEDVHGEFKRLGPTVRDGGHLDLKAIARALLEEAGVEEVYDAGVCTICNPRFFSHRRDQGITGRQAGLAWLS